MQALPEELDRLVYWGICRGDEYDERAFVEGLAVATERGAVSASQAAALCTLLGVAWARERLQSVSRAAIH